MTPRQLRALLENNDFTQREAAEALGIHERTIRKFLSGESEIPLTVEYALRWIVHCGDDQELLKRGAP